jgi:hypothetical protein
MAASSNGEPEVHVRAVRPFRIDECHSVTASWLGRRQRKQRAGPSPQREPDRTYAACSFLLSKRRGDRSSHLVDDASYGVLVVGKLVVDVVDDVIGLDRYVFGPVVLDHDC